MKRFLVFVIICIVTLSLGLTTYYFLRDNEIIVVKDSYFEVNVTDTFIVDIEHTKPNPNTVITFESLHPNIVQYNPVNEVFEAISGGRAIIRVSSNKTDFKPVTIEVVVGDGTVNAPFFIKKIEDILFIGKETIYDKLGNSFVNPKTLDKAYKLQTDLDLSTLTSLDATLMQNNSIPTSLYVSGVWLPIGNGLAEGFSGMFDFNGHTIYNMSINSNNLEAGLTISNAGLFATLEETAIVKNLILENVTIEGSFDNAGAIAGVNYGTIERSNVLSGTVVNSQVGGIVGGAVGTLEIINNSKPRIDMVYISVTVNTGSIGGGLIGKNFGGLVIRSYSNSSVVGNFDTTLGGLVGVNEYKTIEVASHNATIKDCYYYGIITSEGEQKGAIIGLNINKDDEVELNMIRGNYYSTEISGEINAIGGILNTDIDTDKIGVFNKTIVDLQRQQTYYSCTDRQGAQLYWSFTKTWSISAEINNGLPVLNMDSPKVDDGIFNIADGVSIYTINDLLNIKNDMNGNYILKANLDLSTTTTDWIPLGYSVSEEGPEIITFNGQFSADIDPNTQKPYVISNLLSTSVYEVGGLFAYIGAEGFIRDLTLENVKILGGNNVGAVAGINDGIIDNVSVINSALLTNYLLTATNNLGEANVGAIVGINNGTINGVFSELTINVNSTSGNHSNGGGLVGINNGYITSSNSKATIVGIGSYSKYIGGICGSNINSVEATYFTGDITASTNSDQVFVGGITGYNDISAELKYSYVSEGNYQGFAVGGLVGVNRGKVLESYVDIINIKAKKAGGLIFNISEGIVKDCYTLAFLSGLDSNSTKAGFAYFIEYHNASVFGKLENCFSAATFDNVGKNYAETSAPVRTEGFLVPRQAGYIEKCIYDAQYQVLEKQNFVSLFNMEFVIPESKRDIEVTTEHATGTDGEDFSKFHASNFSTSTWSYEEGDYPKLINVQSTEEE